MRFSLAHIFSQACRLVCVWGLVCGAMCGLSACNWQEAKEVIAVADSIDQNEHVIYDDTAALGKAIRCLDNPLGRVMMSNTLGKAYYYMGRNLEDDYQQVAQAAKCYIEADRLQIDDPIYRGRVNSCMGYIGRQNNTDSLALIFYERAAKDFIEGGNEWRYAQSLLNIVQCQIYLKAFSKADSILHIAQLYQLDSAYQARWYETLGLFFYEQQQYESALEFMEKGFDYWQSERDRCFSYLTIMRAHLEIDSINNAMPYAQLIIENSNNSNYLVNAYYCLLLDAKAQHDADLLSKYSHAREDANRLLNANMSRYAEAVPILEEHLQSPYPWRWVWITLTSILIVCILLALGAIVYHKRARVAYQQLDQLSTHMENQEARLNQELYYRQLAEKLSNIVDRYNTPHKRWKEYTILKRDLNPWLHLWLRQLDTLPLSDREKVYCTISLIYSHMTDTEIAAYLCYDKHGIRTFKQRIAKKLGTTAAYLLDYLRHLPLN